MKNKLTTIASSLLLTLNSTAQSGYQYENYFSYFANTPASELLNQRNNTIDYNNIFYTEEKKAKDKRIELKLSGTSVKSTNKKGKIKYSSDTKFNSKGRVIEFNDSRGGQTIRYNSDTIITENITFSKKQYSKITYHQENTTTTTRETNKDNKLIKENIITKNEKGQTISNFSRFGKKLEFSTEFKIFYNSEGKIEKRQHFKNGILEHEWTYDCSDQGKLMKKENVYESSTCKWVEEKNDGSYISYSRELSNGNSYLSKYEFNKDSVPLSVKVYLQDTILISHSEKIGTTEIVKHYNTKGKLINLNTIITNSEGQRIFCQKTRFGLIKHTSIMTYEYDENGKMTLSTNSYNRNIIHSKAYKYDENGMINAYSSSKNGEIISTTEILYTYN